MKNLLVGLSLLLLITKTHAQPTVEWQRAFGGSLEDVANTIKPTSDGGYIVAGSTKSIDGDVATNHGKYDIWVLKLGGSGYIQWQKSLGGSEDDFSQNIIQTSDGGYSLVGRTRSNNGDVTGNHGDWDVWVVKLDENGNLQWERALGGTAGDKGQNVLQTMDGGYIVCGGTTSTNGDVLGNHNGFGNDLWVVKLNSEGGLLWQKCLGGNAEDFAHAIQQTNDGGYIVGGQTSSNDGDVSGAHGAIDSWVLKLTSAGTIDWQKVTGGTSDEITYSIDHTSDGCYITAGFSRSQDGDIPSPHCMPGDCTDFSVLKLSETGSILSYKSLGGTSWDEARFISQTDDGGYLATGFTYSNDHDVTSNHGKSDIWVIKLNQSLDIVWQKTFGGTKEDQGRHIRPTSDGGYILTGYTWSNDGDVSGNHGMSDFWVAKLSPESVDVDIISEVTTRSSLEISPNPSNDQISIKLALEEPTLHLSISNMLGQQINTFTIPNGGILPVSFLPEGVYVVHARSSSGASYTAKWRKQN